jgi:hypothetical protein
MTATEFAQRIHGARHSGAEWVGHCPAHEDRNPSLTWKDGEKGVVVTCHAGCSIEKICAAVGVRVATLFYQPRGAATRTRPRVVTAKAPREKHPPTSRDAESTPREVVAYSYRDEKGALLYEHVRYEPKTFRFRRVDERGRQVWNLDGVRRVIYRWPELIAAMQALPEDQRVAYIPEGERDVETLRADGLPATCNDDGAAKPGARPKWRPEFTQQLVTAGVTMAVILPDNDEPGRAHAAAVARSCSAAELKVKVLPLPGLPPKGDVSDWVKAGHTREELLGLVEAAPAWTLEEGDQRADAPAESAARAQSQKPAAPARAANLLSRLLDAVELFHAPDDRAYSTIEVGDHVETCPVRSKGFRAWLVRSYYERTGMAPAARKLSEARDLAEARALAGASVPVHVRVAGTDGRIYLDLADKDWRVVEVDADGWRVCDKAPVKFRRGAGMLPLPEPVRGGNVDELCPIVNVEDPRASRLLVGWLVMALAPWGPFPTLVFLGEQGTAKSWAANRCRDLIDPTAASARSGPRDERDLAVSARNGWVVSLDNISALPNWLSDALCRLSTGSGFSTRELYTDDDEVIFAARRPVILNGIGTVVTRSDLLDRSLLVELPVIPDTRRRDERELLREFEGARPRILGALLDAVSGALRCLPTVHLARAPRLADFAHWISAAEPTLGWAPGTFTEAYDANRTHADEDALEASPIPGPLYGLIDKRAWHGTATELLDALAGRAAEPVRGSSDWPANPRVLSSMLRRLAPNLRRVGVQVVFSENARPKTVRIYRAVGARAPTQSAGNRATPSQSSVEVGGGPSGAGVANPALPSQPVAREASTNPPPTQPSAAAVAPDANFQERNMEKEEAESGGGWHENGAGVGNLASGATAATRDPYADALANGGGVPSGTGPAALFEARL